MLEISNKIVKTDLVPWRELLFIQTKGFKSFDSKAKERLRNSMIKNSFVESFYVWHDEAKGKLYCLDGYHRIQMLKELSADGYAVPEKLTANFVQCQDRKEAAKYVLLYSSIYARLHKSGFDDILVANSLEMNDVQFEIDLPEFDFQQEAIVKEEHLSVEEDSPEELNSELAAVVGLGDVFRIGEHRIMCGDSTDETATALLFDNIKINGVFTSPPYAEQRPQYASVPTDAYVEWFEKSAALHKKTPVR